MLKLFRKNAYSMDKTLNGFICTLCMTLMSVTSTENRLLDAGYFYATFQNSNLAMNLVQLANGRTGEEQRKAVLKATEEITEFGPEVVLLYTSKEIAQLLLQQVR